MTTTQTIKEPQLDVEAKECVKCGHIRVCSIYRTFSPYLEQQFTEKTKPFEAWDLAVICKAYFSEGILSVLGTGE